MSPSQEKSGSSEGPSGDGSSPNASEEASASPSPGADDAQVEHNFDGQFQISGDHVQGRFVSFNITDRGLSDYRVTGVRVFASVEVGDLSAARLRVDGAELRATADMLQVQVIDNPTGHLAVERDGHIEIVLDPSIAASVPASDHEDHGRLLLSGPGNLTAFVSGDRPLIINGSRIDTEKELRFAMQAPGLHGRLSHGIDEAIRNGTIVAEVDVAGNASGGLDAVEMKHGPINLTLDQANASITLTVNGTGPGKVLLFNVQRDALGRIEDLVVRFDGKAIEPADDLQHVLNVTADDPPQFLVVVGHNATQVLVAVPHFSTHTIELASMAPQSAGAVQVLGPSGSMAAFAAAALLTLGAAGVAVAIRNRHR